MYRHYDQPGRRNPRVQIPDFEKQKENYSPELKALCRQDIASRTPANPDECPRCDFIRPKFIVQPGYRRGLAGAIIFVCMECRRPHVPIQFGPSDDLLRRIEQVRDADLKMKRARGAANSAVVGAKKGRTQGRPAARIGVAAQLLFRNPVPDMDGGIQEGPDLAHMAHEAPEKKLTIIFFFKENVRPVSRLEAMRDEKSIMLADYPWIVECCDPGHIFVFQYWHIVDQGWILIPFMTSAVSIEDNIDFVFLRVYGINTLGLGLELRRYDELHGLALSPNQRVSKHVSQDIPNHVWLVFWTQDHSAPEVFSMVLQGGTNPSSDALFGKEDTSYWVESEQRWAAFPHRDEPMQLEKDAMMVLLRRKGVRHLLGFGDALETLESVRSNRVSVRVPAQAVAPTPRPVGQAQPHVHAGAPLVRRRTLPDVLPIVYENGEEVIDISDL